MEINPIDFKRIERLVQENQQRKMEMWNKNSTKLLYRLLIFFFIFFTSLSNLVHN
ncbi:hypothetical protein NLG42_21490 [Flavobacterium plurextorum]|uniref:hypothetical protein n=1 Tax=Flavobacterium TaxID=237 RepID=UPI00214DD6C9|nr:MULTISPECIES: hypothetical protein [Flavobacterium]UUW08665.1 hypothetical protein NLG42_21490 [Flavobacterium plurextorum]